MNLWMRLRFNFFILIDWLLGTRLVDGELAHLQGRVQACETRVSEVQQQVDDLNRFLYVLQVELCVLYLRQRYLLHPHTWLRFSPADGMDEGAGLDLLIGQLVKPGLASVRSAGGGDGTYVYHLRPDWDAIVYVLSGWRAHLEPLTMVWISELRSICDGETCY